MGYWVDRRITDPALFEPGRKPTGPVVIDESHKYAPTGATIFYPSIRVLGGKKWTKFGSYTIDKSNVSLNADSCLYVSDSKMRADPQKFTVVFRCRGVAFDTWGGIIGESTGDGATARWFLQRSSSTTELRMYINTINTNLIGYTTTDFITDDYVTYVLVRDGTYFRLYANGVLEISASVNSGSITRADDDRFIVGAERLGSTTNFQSDWEFCFLYNNKRFKQNDVTNITNNPYQFLIPA